MACYRTVFITFFAAIVISVCYAQGFDGKLDNDVAYTQARRTTGDENVVIAKLRSFGMTPKKMLGQFCGTHIK